MLRRQGRTGRCPQLAGLLFTVSELDHHLDRFTVIHRTIAIGDTVKLRDAIEHEARSIRPANSRA
jgi:hypothetical protein